MYAAVRGLANGILHNPGGSDGAVEIQKGFLSDPQKKSVEVDVGIVVPSEEEDALPAPENAASAFVVRINRVSAESKKQ